MNFRHRQAAGAGEVASESEAVELAHRLGQGGGAAPAPAGDSGLVTQPARAGGRAGDELPTRTRPGAGAFDQARSVSAVGQWPRVTSVGCTVGTAALVGVEAEPARPARARRETGQATGLP